MVKALIELGFPRELADLAEMTLKGTICTLKSGWQNCRIFGITWGLDEGPLSHQ